MVDSVGEKRGFETLRWHQRAVEMSPGGHKLRDDIRSEGNGASDPGHSSPAEI